MPIEKRTFQSGMNVDLTESLLQDGMYRYALNIRNGNSERGAVGAITNSEGNRLISHALPSGANKVIGAYDDEANDRVIYIIYNDAGNNRVLAYNYKIGVVNTIVADTGNVLDLNPNYLVTGIDVIAADGTTYLLFTDNWGEPKNINIDQGIRTYDTNTSDGQFTYKRYFGNFTGAPATVPADSVYYRDITIYDHTAGAAASHRVYYRAKVTTTQDPTSSILTPTPLSDWEFCPAGYVYGAHAEDSFTNIVKPHLAAPAINYSTTGSSYNYLDGNLYQFKVKYVKPDGRESSWSPITQFISVPTQLDSVLNIDTYNNSRLLFNAIDCYIDVPDTSIYKSIKVAVRRVLNDKSPSDWNLVTRIIASETGNYIYNSGLKVKYTFDGSEALMPLDTNEVSQLMSWIPTKAQAQAITSKNRILYSNFTEGLPYTLDGQRDINQNPPTLTFLERDNPYNTASDVIDIYYYDGTAQSASPITEETNFVPQIEFDDATKKGLAFKFPSTIVSGVLYSISIAANSVVIDGSGSLRYKEYSTNINLIAADSSISNLLNNFVSEINQGYELYANTQDIGGNYGSIPIDRQLLSASTLSSGGSNYLVVMTKEVEVILSPNEWLSTITKVPKASVGVNTRLRQSFKRGSQQTFAIAYSDDYGRITTAIEHPALSSYNPWWKDTEASAGTTFSKIGVRYARIGFEHDAPSWATKFHILKTNSNGIINHVSFPLSKVTGLPQLTNGATNPLNGKYFYRGFIRRDSDKLASATTLTAASVDTTELIYIPLNALQNSLVGYTNLNEAPLAYDYSQGDRIRLCYYLTSSSPYIPTSPSQYFTSESDAEILFYDVELNAIAIRPNDLPNNLVGSGKIFNKDNEDGNGATSGQSAIRGLLCEIYSPQKEKTVDFYYETYTGAISADTANSRYYHVGNIRTQNSAQSAIVELTNGDVFVKPRTYAFKADTASLADSADTITFNYFLEEANFYDKAASKTWGAGRPNRSVKSTSQEEDITGFLGEVNRPTTIRYSEPFLPDQGYNGLSTIYDINFKDANGALKSIQKLHTEGSRVIVFHENSVGFAESDRAVVTTLDENNMTIGANTPLSDIVYYSTRAGIGTSPESFAYNNSRKYFVDIDQGQVCRLSQDGVTPISEQGMNKYFKKVFRDMIKSPMESYAYGAYDKRTEEYILNLKWSSVFNLTGTAAATVVSEFGIGITLTTTISTIDQYDIYEGASVNMSVPEIIGSTFYGYIDFTAFVLDITGTTVKFLIPNDKGIGDIVEALFNGASGLFAAPFKMFLLKSATVAYSEKLKSWSSFHSWLPENMASAGLEFVSFKAGALYIHDDYDNPHQYYGTQYPCYLDTVSNQNGDQVKIWKTLGVKVTTDSDTVDETDFEVAISAADTTASAEPISGGVEDSSGKISTCSTPVYKENQIYFDYMRTGTGTTYADFIEGDKVRGYWAKTRLIIKEGTTKIYKLISTNFDYLMSNYTR